MSSLAVIKFLWLVDFAGTVLGVVLNVLLFVVIFKTSQGKLAQYSYIFIVLACGSIIQSLVEMATEHQLILKNGVLFVLPMGVERHFPSMVVIFFFLHVWLAMINIFVVAAVHKFRYAIIRSTASLGVLLRDLFIVLVVSSIISVPAGIGVMQAQTRNLQSEYLSMIEDGNDARGLIMYVADSRRDFSSLWFVYSGLIFGTINCWLIAYYMYKCWAAIQGNGGTTVSERTIAMQKEFAKSLLVQTVNTATFVMTPLVLICGCLALRTDNSLVGAGIMSPLNWLPAVNAIVILTMIKTYRTCLLKILRCGREARSDGSTTTPIKTFTQTASISKVPA